MPTIKVNGVDRSSSYRPEELAALEIRQIAFDGEVGQGSIPIPDPAGTYEVYAGQRLLIEDGVQVLIDGFVGATTRNRGEGAIGPRRMVGHTLLDENARFQGFRAYQWARSAETTRARFLAFLAAFVPAVTDTTWVLSTNVANMPKKTYTTENLFDELKQEIADLTGNTAFIEGGRAHLHLPTEGFVSTVAISDTAFDFASAFPPDAATGPSRDKDPYELGNDVMVRTPQGSTTLTDATSITRHDAGGLKHQRLVELDSGDSASRTAKATAILAEIKNERITYECDIGPLTAAQVNAIPPGCLINVTSQVMGLSSSTQRVAARTLSYHHPGKYLAHIELGYPIRKRVKPPRTTNPVEEANAVIRAADLEDCGASIALAASAKKNIIEGVDGGWGSTTGASESGSFHITNDPWPGTPCGIASLGAWRDRTDRLTRYDFTVGADSGECVEAQLQATYANAGGHGNEGFYAGATSGRLGPHLWFVGAGAAGAASEHNGMVAGSVFSDSPAVRVPLTAMTFGGTFSAIIGPGFHVGPSYICHNELVNGDYGDGKIDVSTIALQFKKLPAGAYGWFWGGLVGTQNGATTTFTLRGGYTRVRSVTRNGIYLPDSEWTATDGSTITFRTAPLRTDLVMVERYVPK